MWIEVFRTGTHTSGDGRTVSYTDKDLDDMVTKYNSQKAHEAPLVIGHPKTDDPSYGWVKELKRVNDKLHAFVDVVSDKMKDAVRTGMFKKVSIALYGDNLLRHVGLLGATPPAVKDLAPVTFRSGEDYTEFYSETEETNFIKKLIQWIRNDKTETTKEDPDMGNEQLEKKYSELETRFAEALATIEAQGKTITDLLNKQDELKTEIEKVTTEAEFEKRKVRFEEATKGFDIFLEGLIKDGKVLPAEKDGLMDEYRDFYRADQSIKFAEGEKRTVEKFRERLEKREVKMKASGEQFAQGDKATTIDLKDVPEQFKQFKEISGEGLAIHQLAVEYMDKNKGVSYEDALQKVMS